MFRIVGGLEIETPGSNSRSLMLNRVIGSSDKVECKSEDSRYFDSEIETEL